MSPELVTASARLLSEAPVLVKAAGLLQIYPAQKACRTVTANPEFGSMDDDELGGRQKAAKGTINLGQTLDGLSVGELEDYIQVLKDEIKRVEQALVTRRDVFGAAEALFKKPQG